MEGKYARWGFICNIDLFFFLIYIKINFKIFIKREVMVCLKIY